MLIDLWIAWWLQSFPLPFFLSFISWYCTYDFRVLTLNFTLVTSISWCWSLHSRCPCPDIGVYLCGFHAMILDLTMMNSLSASWLKAVCHLYHLCGHYTLQFSLMDCGSLKSLYASCGWCMFMGLLKIDFTHHSYFTTGWCELTFFLENDLCTLLWSLTWLLTVLLIRMCIDRLHFTNALHFAHVTCALYLHDASRNSYLACLWLWFILDIMHWGSWVMALTSLLEDFTCVISHGLCPLWFLHVILVSCHDIGQSHVWPRCASIFKIGIAPCTLSWTPTLCS